MLDDSRADALDICRDILEWRATDPMWETIGDLVEILARAVADDDWATVRTTTAELELLSPNRIKLAGEKPPRKEPPTPLRERVATTITELAK